ncbi:hypothetical protein ACTA71_012656 [Dictyostelium dimigraforme]
MKLTKSLLLLIVAMFSASNAAETFSNFNVTNSAADSQCLTVPVDLKLNNCQSACQSIIKVLPVTGSTSKFTFNQYADDKCETAASSSDEFTCVDGKSKVAIGTTTFSVVCVPDKSTSSEDHDNSSDSSRIGASFALFALVLLSMLAL